MFFKSASDVVSSKKPVPAKYLSPTMTGHGAIFAVFTEVIACQARSGVEIDEHRNRTVSDDLGKAVICAVVIA